MLIEDLVNEIHQDLREQGHVDTKVNIHRVLASFVDALSKNVSVGAEIRIAHLGTFRLKVQKPRAYFNVATNSTLMSEERFRVKFTPAKALKDKLPKSRTDLVLYTENKNKEPSK